VPLCKSGLADEIAKVSTEEATDMALQLAREEGIFAGASTGANVIAALRLSEQMATNVTIVSVMWDTGMKYLKAYRSRWT
jgi:cysteine synthase A